MTRVLCWLARRHLGRLRDGELAPRARARAAVHLERCSACAAELAALDRLHTVLSGVVPDPPEAVWAAFWPQVRARMAAAPPEPASHIPSLDDGRLWGRVFGHRRFAFGSALAVAAVAVLAVLAPWKGDVKPPLAPPILAPTVARPTPAEPSGVATTADPPLVVQAVETADPDSSAMVFTREAPDVTVVWVFGLRRT